MDDDIAAVGDLDRLVEVLLGHQHGQPVLVLELLDLGDHPADQDRGEPDRGFVDQQQPGRRHQGAGDGEHLLFAAAHRAGELAAALGQHREGLVAEGKVVRQLRPRRAAIRAEGQILLDGEPREQAPPLRHHAHPVLHHLARGQPDEVDPLAVDLDIDPPALRPDDAHDAFEQGRLAVAVGAQERHRLALADIERDAVQHAHLAVAGLQPLDRQFKRQDTPFRHSDRRPRHRARRRRSSCRHPAPRCAARTASPRA